MKVLLRILLASCAALALLSAACCVYFLHQAHVREISVAGELAPAGGCFVPAADTTLFVQEAGPARGPAVLFVHGTGAWSETWREPMTVLAAAGYHVVAIDLPPFGFSARPASGDYSAPAQGRRILGVLRSLQLESAVLVGHSFGSGATVEAALGEPSRIRALVLVDAALDLPENGSMQTPAPSLLLRGFLASRTLRRSAIAMFVTNPHFTRRALQSFIADPAVATDARVELYQRPQKLQGTTDAVADWLPSLLLPDRQASSNDPSAYRALTMPALLLWGEADTVTPLPRGQRLASLLPAATLVVLPRVGHIPQIEDTAQFDARLLEFLRVRAPATP